MQTIFPLETSKAIKKKSKDRLAVEFTHLELCERKNFLDYIYGGCELSLTVAIDFSAKNKAQNDPLSLHHPTNEQQNKYMQSIKSVVTILQYYNQSKRIAAYSFGAKVHP